MPSALNLRKLLIALLVVVSLGLVVDRCTERRGRPEALANAARIWIDLGARADSDDDSDSSIDRPLQPVAFWAVKDFELSADQVESGAQTARLLVLGDPEILVYWNGMLVHSELYWVGKTMTSLKVGPLLERRNRVIFEARSDHGAGGLMAALWLEPPESAEADRPLWITDESWQITDSFDHDLLTGMLPLESLAQATAPKVWSKLDLGRWSPLVVSEQSVAPSWPSERLERTFPMRRTAYQGGEPYKLGGTEPWPPGVLVEFETPVRGCLAVSGRSLYTRRAFFFDDLRSMEAVKGPLEFALAKGEAPAAVGARVVPLAGASHWLDSRPEQFKAVLLEFHRRRELQEPTDIWVQPCATSDELASREAPAHRLRWKQTVGR